MTEQHQREQRTEQAIKVRQVTQAHANWNEEERGAPGKFSFQLILDNGAEEYVVRPTAQDAKVILKLLGASRNITFDLERRVLIPNDLPVGG
jgi:hypothetical protein